MAEEDETGYRRIRQVQVRVREKNGGAANLLPEEDEQFLVWLDGVTDYFFVPLKTAADLTMEIELIGLLRDAFVHDKKVKLAYRTVGDNRYISAAWAQHA